MCRITNVRKKNKLHSRKSNYRVAVFQTKMEIVDKGVEKLQVKKITKISLTG